MNENQLLPGQAGGSPFAVVVGQSGAVALDQFGYIRVYLDVSTSLRIVKGELAAAFNNFLAEIEKSWVASGGDPLKLYIAVKVFNSKVTKLGDFSKVDQVVRWTAATYDRHSAFGTALNDAMFEGATKSVEHLARLNSMHPTPFFGVVVLSDGQDTASTHQIPQVRLAVDEAHHRGVRFHFCFVGSHGDQQYARANAGHMGLKDETIATGERTAEGLEQTMTHTAHTIFTVPPRK